MNVLMVYPRYPDTFWSFKHAISFISKKATFPPLGLLTVASMLPKDWNKKLVDLNVKELTDRQILWADLVFISAMIVQKEDAQKLISRCKRFGKKVVAGGPLFTTQHENFDDVDHFVLNEAETTLPLFLRDIEAGTPKRVYTSKERPDITRTPIPMFSLVNLKDYSTMAIQYSRGCPFNCEFCDIVIMNGRTPRTKTPKQLIDECQALYDAGWRKSVFIVDDNFIGNKTKVKELLPELIRWQRDHKYPFRLFTEASTNLADDTELMEMMSAANFYKVFLGIETPNVDSLKECGKMQNVSRNLEEAVKIIQGNGMQVMGGFIVGFDNDNLNIFERQISFIQKTGVVTAMVGVLTALPQTRLWHRLKAEGRLLKDSTGGNTDGDINFIPRMKKEELFNGYKKILANLYSPKQYYQRVNTFIDNYKPTVKGRLTKEEIQAFIKSIWKIGILSKRRKYYWKLFLKTMFKKRKAFATAIELSICQLHFEIITRRILKADN
jgi:radical SAM superfamily enzyme YgiQ (UPF0313 family)